MTSRICLVAIVVLTISSIVADEENATDLNVKVSNLKVFYVVRKLRRAFFFLLITARRLDVFHSGDGTAWNTDNEVNHVAKEAVMEGGA